MTDRDITNDRLRARTEQISIQRAGCGVDATAWLIVAQRMIRREAAR
jgi:hypothetical protein